MCAVGYSAGAIGCDSVHCTLQSLAHWAMQNTLLSLAGLSSQLSRFSTDSAAPSGMVVYDSVLGSKTAHRCSLSSTRLCRSSAGRYWR